VVRRIFVQKVKTEEEYQCHNTIWVVLGKRNLQKEEPQGWRNDLGNKAIELSIWHTLQPSFWLKSTPAPRK